MKKSYLLLITLSLLFSCKAKKKIVELNNTPSFNYELSGDYYDAIDLKDRNFSYIEERYNDSPTTSYCHAQDGCYFTTKLQQNGFELQMIFREEQIGVGLQRAWVYDDFEVGNKQLAKHSFSTQGLANGISQRGFEMRIIKWIEGSNGGFFVFDSADNPSDDSKIEIVHVSELVWDDVLLQQYCYVHVVFEIKCELSQGEAILKGKANFVHLFPR